MLNPAADEKNRMRKRYNRWALAAPLHCEGELIASPAWTVERLLVSDNFQIRLATVADLEVISWHRARMFQDMGELPPDLFESFRMQSRDALRQMFERENYFGWLAGLENEPGRIVAGAGVQLREVPPHPQTNPIGKIDIVSGRQAIIQNVFTEPEWRRRGLAALLIERIIDWTREQGIDSLVLHASDEGRALYDRLGFTATTEMRLSR